MYDRAGLKKPSTFYRYFSYVGFMKFNEDVEDKLRSCLGLAEAVRFSLISIKIQSFSLLQTSWT